MWGPHPNHSSVEVSGPDTNYCRFFCLDCKVHFTTGAIHNEGMRSKEEIEKLRHEYKEQEER